MTKSSPVESLAKLSTRTSVAILVTVGVVLSLVIVFAAEGGYDAPQAVACVWASEAGPNTLGGPGTPPMSLEATSNRQGGYIVERNVLGCQVYWYEYRVR